MSEMLETYLEDLKDSLLLFNETMLKVQKGERGSDIVNAIFRVAHTIKGNSAGIEFTNIEAVMHRVEDILSEVREDKRGFNEDIVKLMFDCLDFLEDSSKIIIDKQTDKDIDVAMLLEKVEKIRLVDGEESGKGNAEIVTPAITQVAKRETAGFRLPSVDTELIEVLVDNCSRGYMVYRLNVELSPVSQMKAVRAWMIFERVDAHSTFVFSVPERPEDEEIKSGEFDFEGSEIDSTVKSCFVLRNSF